MTKELFSTLFNSTSVVAILFMAFSNLSAGASTYKELEWVDLMPAGDIEALVNTPDFLSDIPGVTEEDPLNLFQDESLFNEGSHRFQQAMTSTEVVDTYENKQIRIPGFIVPLELDENKYATEFFIVPYFGACIHMPPPPPNQMIYSSLDIGVEVENLYDPFWFEGTLTIETNHNSLGTSSYGLILDNVVPYEEE
jgi:hypothetical protein